MGTTVGRMLAPPFFCLARHCLPRVIFLVKEVLAMAYETKVLLMAFAKIIMRAKSMKEIYQAVADMANVEGMMLKPYEEAKAELEE